MLCAREIYQGNSIFVVKDKSFISVSIFVASLITSGQKKKRIRVEKSREMIFSFLGKELSRNGNPLQRYGFSQQLFPHMLDNGNRKYIAAKNKGKIIFHHTVIPIIQTIFGDVIIIFEKRNLYDKKINLKTRS